MDAGAKQGAKATSAARPVKATKGAPPPATKGQIIALVAVVVSMACIFAALYVYSSGGSHQGYVPGDQKPLAPAFTLTDSEGATVSLAQYNGSVVVLDFMGTTCEPCKAQIDNLKSVHSTYAGRGVKIVSIDTNVMDSNSFLQGFKLDRGGTWPFAIDTAGAATNDYKVLTLPTLVIIDQTGHIVTRNEGVEGSAEIMATINPLLGG